MRKIFLVVFTLLLLSACDRVRHISGIEPTSEINQIPEGAKTPPVEALKYVNAWQFDGNSWKTQGTPPSCPQPVMIHSPVDLGLVTSVLYPGQTRGGQYKPHGGFRFDSTSTNEMVIKAPMDAELVRGARYIEQGEVQYLLDFISPCGILYRFDHLANLSPAFEKAVSTLHPPQPDDSRTHDFAERVQVKKGDVIATEVGFKKNKNVSVDFGLYDLRQKNSSGKSGELSSYGVCWFDYLSAADKAKIQALPSADQVSGTQSDYCN